MKTGNLIFLIIFFSIINFIKAQTQTQIGLYRTFERSLENNNVYSNKFSDVQLTCTYISPSGDTTDFYGFFDGNGNGGGDKQTGNIWKIRFTPNEVGEWNYKWSWSDTTTGGEGSFICDSANAGKGILRAYKENPRWLAYNGTDPVWLKSYYESGHGSIAQPLDWISQNIYQPMIDRGYNHFQVNWLLSLCCFEQYYHDGPAMTTNNLLLYESGKASSTMNLNVWQLMEQHVSWLNDKNIGLHMFLGFDGSKNRSSAWDNLNANEKDFYVKYVVARLAPYANIAGWSFVWEVPGDRESHELGWARLVKKYDVFDHLRTYQDEHPGQNEYSRPEYNFAAIENHYMFSQDRTTDRLYWKEPWTHHEACLAGYVTGKPVYMIEGNALWRRFWQSRTKATLDDLRQSAWACVTAGASFNWCGHLGENELKAFGPEGLPFFGDINSYAKSANEIDILTHVMNNKLEFYKMGPADSLLSNTSQRDVWCLTEPGRQYLVFSCDGKPFNLKLKAGQYNSNQWINAITGADTIVPAFTAADNEQILFTPPNTETDWVLLIRKEQNIIKEANILSAESDESGLLVKVSCSKEMNIPANYLYGFTITDKDSKKSIAISSVAVDSSNKNIINIELSDNIIKNNEILLTYTGTLASTDSAILAPRTNLPVKNNSKAEVIVNIINTFNKLNYSVYPNPCSEYIDINGAFNIDMIRIFDITGKLVFEKDNITQTSIKISTGNFQPGMYLIYLTSENINSAAKFTKQ
ncbi:MAG: DUF5060 domain-containing protein [Bacteroidales bacterium]